MKVKLNDFGPIEKAELELGELTIIAGRNNTGKTYVTHALYGFLRHFRRLPSSEFGSKFFESHFNRMIYKPMKEVLSAIDREGGFSWKVDQDFLLREQKRLISELAQDYTTNRLHQVFNVRSDHFEGASFEVALEAQVPTQTSFLQPLGAGEYMLLGYDGGTCTVAVNSDLSVKRPQISSILMKGALRSLYFRMLLGDVLYHERHFSILTSVRHAIPLFMPEMDVTRNQMDPPSFSLEDDLGVGTEPESFMLHHTNRYTLPISDNINFFRRIPDNSLSHTNPPFNEFSDSIEKALGGYFITEEGKIRFVSSEDSKSNLDIPFHLASSSAWEMSNLYFFLCYSMDMEGGYFVIIDEPESHLDTANQIVMARLLAQLVNSGNRILITTHSDYLIKEVNNLLMLSNEFANKRETLARLGYQEFEVLSPSQVRAYTAENGILTRNKVDEFGIKMPVFDQTIDGINRTARELFTRIKREKGED